ncbi:MAG: hypothetical protein HYT80_09475 [Euryarchaeota archaeon]|nr:hypothetical protein [Euryarchaeota archaeon]
MEVGRTAAIVAACFVAFSGCLAEPSAPPGRTRHVITDPNDFSYLDDKDGIHVHDYWDGRQAIVLFDKRIQQGTPSVNFGSIGFPLDPGEGQTVIPGTRWINATVNWTNRMPTTPALYFEYRTPTGATGRLPVPPNAALSIPLNTSMNDLPHAHITQWSFALLATTSGGPTLIQLDFHARIEIVRTPGELEPSPPHPDRWGANTTVVLSQASGPLRDANPSIVAVGGRPALEPRLLAVPWDTTTVRILFQYNSSTPEQFHYDPSLSYHGADRTTMERNTVRPNESRPAQRDGRHVWTIPVEPRMWDSPYADASLWGLRFSWFGNLQGSNNVVSMGRPVVMDGDYRLAVEAHR